MSSTSACSPTLQQKRDYARVVELCQAILHRVRLDPFYTWGRSPRHRKQERFIGSLKLLKCAVGANRSGKTEGLVRDGVERMVGFAVTLTRITGRLVKFTDQRCRIISDTEETAKDIVVPKIESLLPLDVPIKWNRKDKRFEVEQNAHKTRAGGFLELRQNDQGRRGHQGTSRTWVGFDEEPGKEEVYDENYARVVDCNGVIAFSFTSLLGSRWLWKVLKDDTNPDLFMLEMGMIDNPYLPEGALARMERRFKPGTDQWRIRVKGEYLLQFGQVWFQREDCDFQRDTHIVDTTKDLRVTDIRAVRAGKTWLAGELSYSRTHRTKIIPAESGRLRVFRAPRPGRVYAIGLDAAGGNTDGDALCAQVVDAVSLEQVAVYHGRFSPAHLAEVGYMLGTLYNDALLAPETNWHGTTVLHILQNDFQYGHIYRRIKHDKLTGEKDGRFVPAMGWYTDARTKKLMAGRLRDLVERREVIVRDSETLDEMRAYGFLTDETAAAKHGLGALTGHDDRVDALAIAVMAAEQAGEGYRPTYDQDDTIGEQIRAMVSGTHASQVDGSALDDLDASAEADDEWYDEWDW